MPAKTLSIHRERTVSPALSAGAFYCCGLPGVGMAGRAARARSSASAYRSSSFLVKSIRWDAAV
jgi:hypothetical protein